MRESSIARNEAGRRLHRVLAGIAAQIEGDLRRIHEFPEGGVHSLRRRMKKLGSILRLARTHIPDRTKQRIKQHIRLLKDAFASARDADVMRRLAADLGIPAEAVGLLKIARPARPKVSARHWSAAEKLRGLIRGLPLHAMTWEDVASSFLRTAKKERDAWKAAREDATAGALHAWRKQAKALHCQMLFIHQLTRGMTRPMKLAGRLGRWLGRHHDLDVLASRLGRHTVSARRLREIGKRQRELRRRIFQTAGSLHDKSLAKKLKHASIG